jgi:CPA2 family monovalent cation:H+ antiporter-2
MAVGLGLFQIGEFSFVLARVGVTSGSIDEATFSLVLSAAVITMVMTPLVSGSTARLYGWRKARFKQTVTLFNLQPDTLTEHVVIAGGGRVGHQLGRTLQKQGLHFVLIELDQRRVDTARKDGMTVLYGDASQEIVLKAAKLATARLLLITVPGNVEARSIASHARRLSREIHIVARASSPEQLPIFQDLDITEVVIPEFEAGLEMTRQAFLHLGIPSSEIQRHSDALREEVFGPVLATGEQFRTLGQLRSAEQEFELQWVNLVEGSGLVGASIGGAHIRRDTGAAVVGVLRGSRLETNPGASFRFEAGDRVAVIGTDEARLRFDELARLPSDESASQSA